MKTLRPHASLLASCADYLSQYHISKILTEGSRWMGTAKSLKLLYGLMVTLNSPEYFSEEQSNLSDSLAPSVGHQHGYGLGLEDCAVRILKGAETLALSCDMKLQNFALTLTTGDAVLQQPTSGDPTATAEDLTPNAEHLKQSDESLTLEFSVCPLGFCMLH